MFELLRQNPFLRRYGQLLFNIALFLNFGSWIVWQTYNTWSKGNLGYVELAFAIQNAMFLTAILIRRRHQAVDMSVFNQMIAAIAFCSGLAFMGQAPTAGPIALRISQIVTFSSHILIILALLGLGRSFGILIAFRSIKTKGVYGIVRHPMYGGDILLRIGFLISHLNVLTVVLFVASTACYFYRAILEERFLSREEAYQHYIQKVRFRFIPYVV